MSTGNDENSVPGVTLSKDRLSGQSQSPAGVLKLSNKANIIQAPNSTLPEKEASSEKDEICLIATADVNYGENADGDIMLISLPPELEVTSSYLAENKGNDTVDDDDIITFKSAPAEVCTRENERKGESAAEQTPPAERDTTSEQNEKTVKIVSKPSEALDEAGSVPQSRETGKESEVESLESSRQPAVNVSSNEPVKEDSHAKDAGAENVTTDVEEPKEELGEKMAEENPFKPKKQLANTPDKVNTDDDPFKPKSNIASSPVSPVTEKGENPDGEDPVSDTGSRENEIKDLAVTVSAETSAGEQKDAGDQSDQSAKDSTLGLQGLELDSLVQGDRPDKMDNPLLLASGEDLGFGEDMFLPGSQVFNDPSAWELLEKFGGSGDVKESNLRKYSLYVKFDPLVKQTLPKTPDKMPAPTHSAPRRAPSQAHEPLNTSLMNVSALGEESICLMGTPPRVARRRSILSQRRMNTSVAQTITEEESFKPVDLLFSIEGETDTEQFEDGVQQGARGGAMLVQVAEEAKYTESEWRKLQQTLAMQYEGQLLLRERDFATQLEQKEAKIRQQLELIEKVKGEKKAVSDSVQSMKFVITEYEKTLNLLIAAKEKATEEAKKEVEAMRKEKDQALEDSQGWENSFSEIHRRYEKLKATTEGFMKNEETLKNAVKTYQEEVKAAYGNVVKVKAKAEEKIQEVVEILEKTKAEKLRVEAELKRNQVQLHSLEGALQQKNSEAKELTELCETLMGQVGAK